MFWPSAVCVLSWSVQVSHNHMHPSGFAGYIYCHQLVIPSRYCYSSVGSLTPTPTRMSHVQPLLCFDRALIDVPSLVLCLSNSVCLPVLFATCTSSCARRSRTCIDVHTLLSHVRFASLLSGAQWVSAIEVSCSFFSSRIAYVHSCLSFLCPVGHLLALDVVYH